MIYRKPTAEYPFGSHWKFPIAIAVGVLLMAARIFSPLYAQEPTSDTPLNTNLPTGFARFLFGMSPAMIEQLIEESEYLESAIERSLVPRTTTRVLSVRGTSFIRRAHFQFNESGLISVILNINEEEVDHYALYSHLSARYGPPQSLNPRSSEWRSVTVILRLERPLTVKYIARSPLENRQQLDAAQFSEQESTREAFIDLF